MTDITGSFTLPAGVNLPSGTYRLDNLDSTTRAKIEDALAAQGKGDLSGDNLVQIQTAQNQDGTISVSYAIALDPPDDVDSNDLQGASNKIRGLANDSDSMADVYQIMEEFFLIAKKQRDISDQSDKSLLKEQVQSLKDSAADIKAGAGWALAGAIAMGSMEILGGIAQLGAASKALGAVNEARGLTNQANELTAEEPQLTLDDEEPNLSLDDDEESDLDSPNRKNAIDLSDENKAASADSDKEDVNSKTLKQAEDLQEQDAENQTKNTENKLERQLKAAALKAKAELLIKWADTMTQRGQGVSAALGGAGQAMKGGGDFANTQFQGDAKTDDAAATQAAGQRDSMLKFKDNAQQSMNSALQGLGQIISEDMQTVRKIWS